MTIHNGFLVPRQSFVHPLCMQSYTAAANRLCINDCACRDGDHYSANNHAHFQDAESHSETEISLTKVCFVSSIKLLEIVHQHYLLLQFLSPFCVLDHRCHREAPRNNGLNSDSYVVEHKRRICCYIFEAHQCFCIRS